MEKLDNKNIPFIGTGWAFPVEFQKSTKEVILSSGEKDIKESLEILLSTQIGERNMNPKFGCNLSILLFEPLDVSLEEYIKDLIKTAILDFEPRITFENLKLEHDSENNVIYLNIEYIIKTTNSRTNMVYPFYLKEGTNLT